MSRSSVEVKKILIVLSTVLVVISVGTRLMTGPGRSDSMNDAQLVMLVIGILGFVSVFLYQRSRNKRSNQTDSPIGDQVPTTGEHPVDVGQLFSAKGRVGRAKYWKTIIAVFLVGLALVMLPYLMLPYFGTLGGGIFVLTIILQIPLTWIVFATIIKRWHDRGRSGWFALTTLIPYINILILLYLGIAKGIDEPNDYGENTLS